MELVFQEQKLEILSKILCDTVSQEQTADVIIPDSIPDAARVADAFGTLLIRAEECSGDSAAVAGTVQAGALVVCEDGSVQRVDAEIPFSVRRDFPKQEDECMMQCSCILRSVDARLLNSRKILLRVCVSCALTVYAPKTCTSYDISEPAQNLQMKRVVLPLRMPAQLGEKSFTLNEVLEVPSGKPEIARLLKCLYRTQVEEQRMVGNKAVFKGELTVHALYAGEDEELHTYEWSIPFSQYAELEREMDEGDLRTELSLTGAEAEPDSQFATRRLLVSATLLAQCTVFCSQNVSVIEDAYCTDADFTPTWEAWSMTAILDQQDFRETAIAESDLQAQRVVDCWFLPDEAAMQRTDGQMQIELPLSCSVLYYDADGDLQGRILRPTVRVETQIADNAQCSVAQVSGGEIFCSAGSGGIAVRIPVKVSVDSFAEHAISAVSGGEITPTEETAQRRPAVLLRLTDREESVWEIAKSCRADLRLLTAANELNGASVPAGTLLLIPM